MKEHFCTFGIKSQSDKQSNCEVLGCPGKFKRLPPMLEGRILSCYRDINTAKSGMAIAEEMGIEKTTISVMG